MHVTEISPIDQDKSRLPFPATQYFLQVIFNIFLFRISELLIMNWNSQVSNRKLTLRTTEQAGVLRGRFIGFFQSKIK